MEMEVRLVRSPFVLRREVSVERASLVFRVRETIVNKSEQIRPLLQSFSLDRSSRSALIDMKFTRLIFLQARVYLRAPYVVSPWLDAKAAVKLT